LYAEKRPEWRGKCPRSWKRIFYLGSYPAKFIEEFAAIGVIVSPVIGGVGAGAGGACRRIRVNSSMALSM
jgi:hypothetical protein